MKILMVSMPTLHFFRWTDQLKDAGHEVFWFDILGMSGYVDKLDWVQQKVGWKLKYKYPGRTFLKKSFPKLYQFIQRFNERKTVEVFEKYLQEVNPNAVHSFAMQISCVPIIDILEKNKHIKWIYSSWGSDMFYLNSVNLLEIQVRRVLKRVDYFISDCHRDYKIAENYGFKGRFLGVFPGGGGYDFNLFDNDIVKPIKERKIISIKGYQGELGRCLQVLYAIKKLEDKIKGNKVVVFSADIEVVHYIEMLKKETILNIEYFEKEKFLPQNEIMKLMGKSLIYIGNSVSDGIPNTLIEAIVMGAFPIQSNPGGVSSELIKNNENGFLIENPEDNLEIESLIFKAISNDKLLEQSFEINQKDVKPKYELNFIKNKVVDLYNESLN
ncbi:glycosyltransferase [Flavobacteriaceae bacterium SZ-1-7]|uniref:glycosyltransferase n=1 Tax=Tamlana sedimenti TaxID=3134126 RepID=UPI003122463A